MATITAGTNFPTTLVTEMFNKAGGHSALAKLSGAKPIPFNGETVMVFNPAGEASLVAEGVAKPAKEGTVDPVVIRPQKFVYQLRVSDEFVRASEEGRLNYLQTFADGFAKKIARALDIAAFHGVEPATGAEISGLDANNIDDLVASGSIITYDSTNPDTNLDAAVAAIQALGREVNGIALSPAFGAALGALKANGIAQFPEYRFGQNPGSFYGMGSDVNSTVAYTGTASGAVTDYAIVGDFVNAIRWGYSVNVPLEVIQYGDPDGTGHDLKQYNEVLLRAEAYIGWGILDGDSFAVIR